MQAINKFYLFVFILFFSCQNNTNDVQEFIYNELPVELIEDANLLYTEFGKLKVNISAKKIERFISSPPRLVFTDDIQVVFFGENSDTTSHLKSNKAFIDEDKNLMYVSDNVVLVSSNGNILETSHLIWDEKIKKIYTNEKVVITTDNEIIHATGLISDPDFVKYSLQKVNGVLSFTN